MLAGPALPEVAALAGQWAVSQGRRPIDDMSEGRARVEVDRSGGADVPRDGRWEPKGSQPPESEESDGDESTGETQSPPVRKLLSRTTSATKVPTPRRPLVHSATSQSARQAFESAPAFSAINDTRGRDPFSQSPVDGELAMPSPSGRRTPGTPTHQAFHSLPDFSARGSPLSRTISSRPPAADALLAMYSADAQRQLLKSHYTRSEIRFLLHLEDISNRLLVIPKPARISALRAELTSLNHNLPAEVCMPLWCNADHGKEEKGSVLSPHKHKQRAHSRVVRISPGDSVVLNSAERAPYLLHVEILEDDLDFDPARRENRELLKKIVVQEDMKRRKKEGGEVPASPGLNGGFGNPAPISVSPMLTDEPEEDLAEPEAEPNVNEDVPPEDMEEMDLVEQLYGNKLSVRDTLPDLADALPLPNAPKNKQLDLEVWNAGDDESRRSSLGNSPLSRSRTPVGGLTPERVELGEAGASLPESPQEAEDGPQPPKRVITLEDYAERMRTAAVMLAQLNASVQPPVPEAQSSSGGALKWIPGTGWIKGGSKETPAEQPGQAGAGGKLRLAATQAAAIRQRIMEEMMALEDERVNRMTTRPEGVTVEGAGDSKTAEDEGIVRREINKADPSAAIFKESWTTKKSRIRAASPWGHLANWDVISVIVKTGADLRQEQLATQLIERFVRIWKEENCDCYARL